MANKILVIDDEEIVGESLRKIFSGEDYEIETAYNGQEGIRKARSESFDLMIVDLKMPDISGLDVISAIKEEQPDAMIIMITGYSAVDSAVRALKTGAFDYIPKPFTPDEISAVVESALETKNKLAKEKQEQEAFYRLYREAFYKPYKGEEAELIPILQHVQAEIGFLPEEAMIDTARFIGVPKSRVYAVATFYSQFRFTPIGRNHIMMCRGTACHVKGASRILEEVEKKLGIKEGETTSDLEFSLETVACIGACGLAPNMVINKKTYGRLTKNSVSEILNSIRS